MVHLQKNQLLLKARIGIINISKLLICDEKEGAFMAYKNPTPILHDEQSDRLIVQENLAAEYTPYKNVYFSFIDVLGFKQTFDDNKENIEFASSFKDAFQYFSLLMNSTRFPKSDWNSGQTSDSLYFYTDRIDYLAAFIKIYSHFSLYAMSQDVFFRGGIAKGGLFVDKPHQFYGDSVIKAYLLESSIAKFPRIVIDQSTVSDLIKENNISDFLICEDPPKRSYVRPFTYMSRNELQTIVNIPAEKLFSIDEEKWLIIEEKIQKNMERFEFDDKNYLKYAFLQSEYMKYKAAENKE